MLTAVFIVYIQINTSSRTLIYQIFDPLWWKISAFILTKCTKKAQVLSQLHSEVATKKLFAVLVTRGLSIHCFNPEIFFINYSINLPSFLIPNGKIKK